MPNFINYVPWQSTYCYYFTWSNKVNRRFPQTNFITVHQLRQNKLRAKVLGG